MLVQGRFGGIRDDGDIIDLVRGNFETLSPGDEPERASVRFVVVLVPEPDASAFRLIKVSLPLVVQRRELRTEDLVFQGASIGSLRRVVDCADCAFFQSM